MVTEWNHPHPVEPRSTEDPVVWGLNIDHEELRDDIAWISADRERDRTRRPSLIPVKPVQAGSSSRVDHGLGSLRVILHSVQSAFI